MLNKEGRSQEPGEVPSAELPPPKIPVAATQWPREVLVSVETPASKINCNAIIPVRKYNIQLLVPAYPYASVCGVACQVSIQLI